MFRRSNRRVVMVLVGMLTASLAAGAAVDTRPAVVRAQEWAATNAGHLPSGSEFAEHQLAFRRAAFVLMSPEAKSSVAQSYLSAYLSKSVTPQQRTFLMQIRALLTPAMYADRSAWKTNGQLYGACSQLQGLFPDKTERELLTTFGARPDRPKDWRGQIGYLKGLLGMPAAHASAAQHLCDCARFTFCTGCMGTGGHCLSGCEESESGCGCFFLWPCTGKCNWDPV